MDLPTLDPANLSGLVNGAGYGMVGSNNTEHKTSGTGLKNGRPSSHVSSNGKCAKHKDRLVFIKTHKTASTTIATLFERYGYENNLTFALPWVSHIFDESRLFNRDMVMTFADMATFNMLTNHARFNRKEMDVVVPHAKYVTIMRDPVSQFESAFGYFDMAQNLELTKKPDPLAAFLQQPEVYFKRDFHMKVQSHNGQIYDLGLDHTDHDDVDRVGSFLATIDKELDLVMLTEYFDESLILLRKLLCWNDNEILYLPKGVRNQKHRYSVSAEIAGKIREWNAADVAMYDHFNRTFWQKVADYGPTFDADLEQFRQLQKNMSAVCLDTNKESAADRRETGYALKADAPDLCNDLVRDDIDYVILIRWGEVRTEFGLPKLLAMIACGLVTLIIVLTAMLFGICRLIERCCGSNKNKYKYTKVNQNSDVL